jgi:hypothetical protein
MSGQRESGRGKKERKLWLLLSNKRKGHGGAWATRWQPMSRKQAQGMHVHAWLMLTGRLRCTGTRRQPVIADRGFWRAIFSSHFLLIKQKDGCQRGLGAVVWMDRVHRRCGPAGHQAADTAGNSHRRAQCLPCKEERSGIPLSCFSEPLYFLTPLLFSHRSLARSLSLSLSLALPLPPFSKTI